MKKFYTIYFLIFMFICQLFMPVFCEEKYSDSMFNPNYVYEGRVFYDENKNIFTGDIDVLKEDKVIKMTVKQALSSGYTQDGDEFFAEITDEVATDKGILLPKGTVAHGHVSQITDSKRLGRDGYISLVFDYLITPDGRQIPIEGQMSTKLAPVLGIAKTAATTTAYGVAGGAVGGLVALNYLGLEAAILSQGYTVMGGAAIGATAGIGYGLFKKGKDVLIAPGDVIKIKINSALKLPVISEQAVKDKEFSTEGLDIRITNIQYEKDPFGFENTITLTFAIDNLTNYSFSCFDIAIVNDTRNSFFVSPFANTNMWFSKISPNSRTNGKLSFIVNNIKQRHWLVFYDRATKKELAKISIDNAKRQIEKQSKKKKK